MAKKHLIELVNKLKDSGINVSLAKPRSKFLVKYVQSKRSSTIPKIIS